MNQGKLVIGGMVAIGVALAMFAWWARYSRSQKVLAAWGPDAVVAIRIGEKVELLQLRPAEPAATDAPAYVFIPADERSSGSRAEKLAITQLTNITDAPGLIHARHHLVHEKGFLWEQARSADCRPKWETALRFWNHDVSATMVFDFRCNRVCLVERETEVSLTPIISEALQFFLAEFSSNPVTERQTHSLGSAIAPDSAAGTSSR